MKPEPYLTELGKKYFTRLAKVLKDRGLDDPAYSIELSALASQYAMYQDAQALSRDTNPETGEPFGFFNLFQNGTVQVNAFHTMQDKAFANILKMSPKFGLTPKDFDAIKDSVKEPEKPKSKLQRLQG